MTKRTLIIGLASLGGLLLVGVLALVVYRPINAFQATIAARVGGFTTTEHRLLKFGWLFPIDAWRLSHSIEAYQHLREHSNFGSMPFPRDVAAEDNLRRRIEKAFSLPPRSLDSYEVYLGDESLISQAILVSKDRTHSYYMAFGYI